MKKVQAERILKKIIKFTDLDPNNPKSLKEAEGLYKAVNQAGFVCKPGDGITAEHIKNLIDIFIHALAYMANAERIGWHRINAGKLEGVCKKMEIDSFPVKVLIDREHPEQIFDLGESGIFGFIFILRFLMLLVGKKAGVCVICGEFFFKTRSDKETCSNKCRTAKNRQ